uniref:Uncharacterized protein n=1 Tax=viral metagenome TaxID=1070528 RepID=A0A6C0J8A6_9ZZZZ
MCCKQRYHSNCLRQWYIEHNLCPSCNTVKVKCFLFKDNLININTDTLIWKNNISIIKIDLCNIRCIIQLNNGNINIISSDLKGDMSFNLEAPDKIIMNKIYHSIVHLHNNINEYYYVLYGIPLISLYRLNMLKSLTFFNNFTIIIPYFHV